MEKTGARWERGVAIGLCAFVLCWLAWFAWRFADERLYADSGYYLFRVINESGIHVEHGRWALVLAQTLPLLGVKLGLPMDVIIHLHSIANVVILALAMAYALVVLKDQRTAVLLALAQIIGLAHGLFSPVFDLGYGVGLVLLFYATLTSDRLRGWTRTAITTVLFIGALSSHPMAWVLLLGSIVLLDRKDRQPVLPMLVLIAACFGVVHGLTMSTYEAAQIAFVQRLAFPSLILDLFTPDTLLEQARRWAQHYPDVLALMAFSLFVLWRSGERRAALLFITGLLGLYVLIGLYLPDPTHDRYREQVDFAFPAWTLLVILSRAWPLASWRPTLFILLVACTGFRVMVARSIAPYYEARTQWHLDLIAQARSHGLHKAIIPSPTIAFGTADDRVAPYWSTGVESLLLSAKDGPERTISVITADDALCTSAALAPDQVVLRCGDVLGPTTMNERYFRAGSGGYSSYLLE